MRFLARTYCLLFCSYIPYIELNLRLCYYVHFKFIYELYNVYVFFFLLFLYLSVPSTCQNTLPFIKTINLPILGRLRNNNQLEGKENQTKQKKKTMNFFCACCHTEQMKKKKKSAYSYTHLIFFLLILILNWEWKTHIHNNLTTENWFKFVMYSRMCTCARVCVKESREFNFGYTFRLYKCIDSAPYKHIDNI